MSREDVRTCLGEPDWTEPALDLAGLGPGATDRYRMTDITVSLAHDAPQFGLALVVCPSEMRRRGVEGTPCFEAGRAMRG